MKIEPRTYDLNGRSLVFRSAEEEADEILTELILALFCIWTIQEWV